VQRRRTDDHAACGNSMLATIGLGFRPDGVFVANELVWIALAPL
jgi:hypothetical protein